MNIIYKSFLRKKINKIYLVIFILLSIIFSFLFFSRNYLIFKENEAYSNSYLVFKSSDNLNLGNEKRIKNYNSAIKVTCDNSYFDIYITNTEPIINIENVKDECSFNEYTINYSSEEYFNVFKEQELYNSFNENSDYYYFVSLKKWNQKDEFSKYLFDKYNVEVEIVELKIDDNDYKHIIFIFDIFIKIVILLFLILFFIVILNIIVDEKINNDLYFFLGYSKYRILYINLVKILLLLIVPFCICLFVYLLCNIFIL